MSNATHHAIKRLSLRGCDVAVSFDYGPALFAHVRDFNGGGPHLLTADELRELADALDERLAEVKTDEAIEEAGA